MYTIIVKNWWSYKIMITLSIITVKGVFLSLWALWLNRNPTPPFHIIPTKVPHQCHHMKFVQQTQHSWSILPQHAFSKLPGINFQICKLTLCTLWKTTYIKINAWMEVDRQKCYSTSLSGYIPRQFTWNTRKFFALMRIPNVSSRAWYCAGVTT